MPNVTITIDNALDMPLLLYENRSGKLALVTTDESALADVDQKIPPKTTKTFPTAVGPMVVKSAVTGGLVTTLDIKPAPGTVTYPITYHSFAKPNEIGVFPKPSAIAVLPPDSERVVVGCGIIEKKILIVREQFWQRSPDSYVLAPEQEGSMTLSVTTGMEEISSTQDTVAGSLSASTSVGFGAFSASISASLSVSSTTFQQFTASSTTTRYETVKVQNTTQQIQMYLKWSLKVVISAFAPTPPPTQYDLGWAIVVAQPPEVVDGPYSLAKLGA